MKSSSVARKRIAMAASWITSDAPAPTIETPSTSLESASATILISPRVSRIAPARGTSSIGMVAHQQRRSEEHTSELQSLMRISYAVFCLKKKTKENYNIHQEHNNTTT